MFFHQVNHGISLDHTRNQWVDLGILEEACITRPETCGTAGGAVALWMKVNHNYDLTVRGIITSRSRGVKTNFGLSYSISGLR